MSGRFFASLMSLLALTACNPYLNRTIVDGHGESHKYRFAYGKYCGPGYPPVPANENPVKAAQAYWPPVDDLDAVCYAHDMCYAADKDQVWCDSALQSTLLKNETKLFVKNKACGNLAWDVVDAFFAKPYAAGKNASETFASRTVNVVLGIPAALYFIIVESPFRLFYGFPNEGDCNVAVTSNVNPVIRLFQTKYDAAARKDRFVVPVPGETSP